MPKIHVKKPFTLTHQDRTQTHFRAGEHEVSESLAAHWYVKANSEPVADPEPQPEPEANSEEDPKPDASESVAEPAAIELITPIDEMLREPLREVEEPKKSKKAKQ